MRMSHNDGSELDANLPKMSNYAHTHLFTEYTPPIFEKPVPLSRIMGARVVIFDTAILSHSDNDDLKARAVPGGSLQSVALVTLFDTLFHWWSSGRLLTV